MFKKSYVSVAFTDSVNSKNYAFGKHNGVIIADVDKNGFTDIVTFPSNFTEAQHIAPVVWYNNNGKFTPGTIPGDARFQYIRDSIAGDFNRDGFEDYILADTGWELNGRNPDNFYGATPVMIKGTAGGLSWTDAKDFISARDGGKTFNHIGDAADYDGDGDLDVAIAAFTPHASNQFRLYKNDGTGKFTWQEGAVDLPHGDPSGTTFIKLGNQWSLVTGTYRSRNSDDPTGNEKPWVLTYDGNRFVASYEINRPELGGRERNYGAADMFNQDLNGDGREDLIITWETEALYGIDDGLSTIETTTTPTQRYQDLTNTIASVYLQQADGTLEKTPDVYNLEGLGSGFNIYFFDFNSDGAVDFYNSSFSIEPKNYHKTIWINDGRGNFEQLKSPIVTETFDSWYADIPFFFDADNNGSTDIISLRPVFGNDYSTRNIGEEIRVYLNDKSVKSPVTLTSEIGGTFVGTTQRDTIRGTNGDDIISGNLGADKLYGKQGADQFVFDTITYTVGKGNKIKSNKNQDTIFDFDVQDDVLVFDDAVFGKFSGDTDWTDNIALALSDQDSDDWLVYDAGRVYYDLNGSAPGGTSLVAQIVGSPQLSIDNFMIA